MLSLSEGQVLLDIINHHGLEQVIHFPTREENTLDLVITTLSGHFQDIHSPDEFTDYDITACTLKTFIPPKKKARRYVYLYQKWCLQLRKDALNLITFFIQEAADKHISLNTSRSVSWVSWIPPGLWERGEGGGG